jgi:hypothetical protein
MNFLKKHHVLSIVIIFLIVVTFINLLIHKKEYSYIDLGVTPPKETDCSILKNKNAITPVSLTASVSNVTATREKLKKLIVTYEGNITKDSFSSYPVSISNGQAHTTDNFEMTIEFKKNQTEFLAELSELLKNSNVDTLYYNYGNSPYDISHSPYSQCVDTFEIVKNNRLHLEVLTKALRREKRPENISMLIKSIHEVTSTLESNITSLNNLLIISDIPSVTIVVNPANQ